jgi:hypothetical protein
MGQPVRLTTEDWARVRYEYEHSNRKVFDICAERGISESTLRDRVRRWGWTRRWSGPVQREGPPPMVVTIIGPQTPEGSPGDPADDVDELRASLKRQIEALIEEEREARPRRYLAAWEEFAAEAATPAPRDAEPCAGGRPVHRRGKSRGTDRRGRRHMARPAYSVTIKA